MSKELGSLVVPIVAALPGSGSSGQVVMFAGQLYSWSGDRWNPIVPIYISPTGVRPSIVDSPYLFVDSSGTTATLWVEDGT